LSKIRKRRKVLFLLVLLLFGCGTKKGGIGKKERYEFPKENFYNEYSRIDKFFRERYKRGLFNGAVLFAEKDKIIYEKVFGYADFKKREKIKLSSAFQLASVSKPVTAIAILMMTSEGKISLEDTLGKFFEDFPYRGVKIKHLLEQRSGLPEYMYFADSLWQDKRNLYLTNEDVLDILIENKPFRYYKPGVRYNYSNTNYVLLALILSKVSGKSYGKFLKENLFEPSGMSNAFVCERRAVEDCRAKVKGYVNRRRLAGDTYLNGVAGDKNIYASVEDLFNFDKALNEGKLISKKLLDKAFTPRHPELYKEDNYGYGWRINTREDGSKIVFHTGWWKGFRSYYIKALKEKKTIIVLSNISNKGILHSPQLAALFGVKWRLGKKEGAKAPVR